MTAELNGERSGHPAFVPLRPAPHPVRKGILVMNLLPVFNFPAALSLICLSYFSGPAVYAEDSSKAAIVSVKRIWDHARHNGFPDLIRTHDKWFCCLREGDRHVGGEDGKIRIISSQNGNEWKSNALLALDGVDLRDASLSEMPDGRLMLVCGGSIYEDIQIDGQTIVNGKYVGRQTRVAFSKDGRDWTPFQKILSPGHWLWRVTWHKGRAYGLSKTGYDANPKMGIPEKVLREGFLYTSMNGVDWELITKWGEPVAGLVSETRIRFTPEDEMIAVIRPVFIGMSKPPYRKWVFRRTEKALQGPNLIILPDGQLWASTRYAERLTPERQKEVGTTKLFGARQALVKLERDGSFVEVLLLPGGGDTGYAGLVWHDGFLWMAYYASGGIYFAKVDTSEAS